MIYHKPDGVYRTEILVSNSRFVTTVGAVTSVEEARRFIAEIKSEMPDASHHVYAFRVGYGNSVTEGLSDDREPSGTAGPPVMAIVRGSNIGDIIVTVSRYFGGTKLGSGGLVRAYSEAARTGIAGARTVLNTEKTNFGIEVPYSLYETVKRLFLSYEGVIDDAKFGSNVTLMIQMPTVNVTQFSNALREASAGQIQPIFFD